MASKEISRNDLAFGRAVLLATDSFGLSAEGAFWLCDSRDDAWRFFLVTSLFDRIGARELYLRLDEALTRTLSAEEMRDFSFFIAAPREKLVQDIQKHVNTSRHATEVRAVDLVIGGRPAKVCIYRLSLDSPGIDVKAAQRRFRKRTNEVTNEVRVA